MLHCHGATVLFEHFFIPPYILLLETGGGVHKLGSWSMSFQHVSVRRGAQNLYETPRAVVSRFLSFPAVILSGYYDRSLNQEGGSFLTSSVFDFLSRFKVSSALYSFLVLPSIRPRPIVRYLFGQDVSLSLVSLLIDLLDSTVFECRKTLPFAECFSDGFSPSNGRTMRTLITTTTLCISLFLLFIGERVQMARTLAATYYSRESGIYYRMGTGRLGADECCIMLTNLNIPNLLDSTLPPIFVFCSSCTYPWIRPLR